MEINNDIINEVDEDEGIVTLISAEGKETDFYEIARVECNGDLYLILQPVVLFEDMAEDEALVFKVLFKENGEVGYELEINEKIVEEVFENYYKMLDEIDPQGDGN